VDTGLAEGDRIPTEYDNLLAKIMVHGPDRDAALDRLVRALDETRIAGVQTTVPFYRWVARDPGFRAGDLSTDWVGEHWDGPRERGLVADRAARLAGLAVLDGGSLAGARHAGRDGRGSVPSAASGWSTVARADVVDRWPR
jgi:Acetyl/propionyl-CoA carboxylase, alpha subunit